MITLTGCEKEELKVGDKFKEDGITVEVISVSDSRCPEDVVCVWEGEATVQLKMTGDEGEHQFYLDLLESYYAKDTIIGSHKIILQDVLPYPVNSDQSTTDNSKKKVKIDIKKV